jgi:hypothetical protein
MFIKHLLVSSAECQPEVVPFDVMILWLICSFYLLSCGLRLLALILLVQLLILALLLLSDTLSYTSRNYCGWLDLLLLR